MLAILEYGAGNQTSVKRALDHLDIPAKITSRPDDLSEACGIIFPGVGAAAQAMEALSSSGMDVALREAASKNQPILGICLGSQILLEKSQEGSVTTLGLYPGECRIFPENLNDEAGEAIKVPHMGWNSVRRVGASSLWDGIPPDAEFYFVHSYYTAPEPELVLGTTFHGLEFCSVYGRSGLWGAQFHPEKSGAFGLRFLANFNAYCQEKAECFPNA